MVLEYELATGASPTVNSPDRKYVYGSYVDAPVLISRKTGTGTYENLFYSRNQQYSITALTDATGSAVERYGYTAYGKTTILDADGNEVAASAFDNPYAYTARRSDPETGLIFFRARMYDADLGRFISRDPLGFVDGMSQYRAYFVPGAMDPSGKLVFLAPLGWMAFSAALDLGSQYVEHRMSGEGEFQINLYRVGFAFATGAIPGGAGQSFKGLGALAKSRQFLNRRREFASMLKSLTNQSNAVRSRILTELSGVLKTSTFAKLFRDQAKNHFGTAFKQFAVKQAMNYKLKEVAKDLNSRNQNELQESTIECSEFKDFRAFPRGLHATIVLLPFTIPAHNIENHAAGTRVPGHLFKERCWRFWYRNSVAVSRREYDCETKKWIGERENL